MDERYRIRSALEADLPALAAAEARCFRDPWSQASLAELFKNRSVIGLVAEANRPEMRLAGYVFARAIAGEAEILNLAVLPEDRKRGVGDGLLAAALVRLTERGTGSVFLEVRESNSAALRLYESRGFRPVGMRADYYERPREHALVLRLDLASVLI